MSKLYEVRKIQGKGYGCVALEDIKKGTLILSEIPQCIFAAIGGGYLKSWKIFVFCSARISKKFSLIIVNVGYRLECGSLEERRLV